MRSYYAHCTEPPPVSTKDELTALLPDEIEQVVVVYRLNDETFIRGAGMSPLAMARLLFGAGTDLMDSLVAAEMQGDSGTRN